MKNYDFDWQINEFMVYYRSTQLRERTMYSYEQTLRLFERWLCDELKIYSVVARILPKTTGFGEFFISCQQKAADTISW